MSRKKKTSPMWTEVENPVRLENGDIILWPKETGPVKHLHGSVSTMRKLGFSIGRCRHMSYKQVEFLQAKPDCNRLFMVRDVCPNLWATEQMKRLGNVDENPVVSHVTAVEIPLDCTLDTPTDAMILFIQTSYLMQDGVDIAKNNRLLGDDSDHIGSNSEDVCLRGLMTMRDRHFCSIAYPGPPIGSILRRGSVYDTGTFGEVVEDSFAATDHRSSYGRDGSFIKFNARVLQNACKYGMKIYRPSPKMREELVAAMMMFSLDLIAKRNRQYLKLTETLFKSIHDFKKRLTRYTSKAHSLAKRNLQIATPTLKALSEITGHFPNCTSLTSKGTKNEMRVSTVTPES